jgi:dihydroorotase
MGREFDLVVRNGTLVTHDQMFRADLGVIGGVVHAVGENLLSGRDEFDATGLHVLPGLVDVHVHMREPGMTEKGDFADGTRAAAAGGVTTVVDMPNTIPPVTDVGRFRAKHALLAGQAHVDFGLYGLFAQDNAAEFSALAEAGCMGMKLYMGRSVGDIPCPDDGAIVAGLEAARDAGLVVGVHAENDHLVALYSDRLRRQGRTDPPAHSEARPELAEVEAVTRIVTFAVAVGAPLHIHHLSSAAALRRIKALRPPGGGVTVEVVIAHLMLHRGDYRRLGNLVKLNPPLRCADDVEALWEGIKAGDIDVIATDHAPHTAAEQAEPNVWLAHGGFIGVETLLPILLTQVAGGRLSLPDVVRMCSHQPARRWKMHGKGTLRPGADADMVLVDVAQHSRIDARRLHSRHNVTPFDGMASTGVVNRTYLRGQLVAADGMVIGKPTGRLVRPRRREGNA